MNMTAHDIVNDPFSSYKYMSSVRHICLPPRYLGNVAQGIRDQLDSEINFYCTDLESVVISYENLKLLQAVGSILDDSPFLHFKIQADYIVFKPSIGSVLKGVVNKVSKDHVGCLVHNRFNASIHRPRQHMNGWRGSQLQQGEEFPFEVLDIYSNNAVISLKGKLIDQKAIEAYLKSLKSGGSKDKPKTDENENEGGDYVDHDEGEITLDTDPVLKKRKRKASNHSAELSDDVEETQCTEDVHPIETPKKKKKTSAKSDDISTPVSIKIGEESSSSLAGKKRRHSLKDAESGLQQTPVSSAKKVRFDDSCLKSSPESKKGKKSTQISPISAVDEVTDIHDGSYLDSSLLDESNSTGKKSKKKKKHKKNDEDVNETETELTKIKSPTKSKQEVKEMKSDNVNEESEMSSEEKGSKKKRKKKSRSESEVSNSESTDGESFALGELAEDFEKNMSYLQKTFSDQKNKKNKKVKDLIGVMQSLQSQVMSVTNKLMTANLSSKKKKQKKKKNRESSSPERSTDSDTPKQKSKHSSQSLDSSDLNSSKGGNSSEDNVNDGKTDSRKRTGASEIELSGKKKKKVKG